MVHITQINFQMLIVTGGANDDNHDNDYLHSTEIAECQGASHQITWRKSQDLPSARYGAAGATLRGIFHVSRGKKDGDYRDNIYLWDGVAEEWTVVGNIWADRAEFAAAEVRLKATVKTLTECLPTE